MFFKIIPFALAPIIALAGAVAIARLLDGEEITRSLFGLSAMIEAVQTEQHTFMFFLGLLAVIGILFLMFTFSMTGKSDFYQSRLIEVTDKIKTPAAVGQSQHGSARWMSEGQRKRAFASFVLDKRKSKNEIVARLFKQGLDSKADLKRTMSKREAGAIASIDE